MIWISGNTYPIRYSIRTMGFTWNAKAKVWERTLPLTPDEEASLSKRPGIVVDNAEEALIDTRAPNREMTYKQRYGRCEDAPCCGCCGPQFY